MKTFHKKHITKKNSFLKVFWTFIILLIALFGFISLEASGSFFNGINKPKTQKVITKDEDGNEIVVEKEIPDTVTFLLVGRGWIGNDAPELTDTIIVAKLNKQTKDISLLSIPRDLFVVYKNVDGAGRRSKINAIYANDLRGAGTERKAMNVLIDKIEQITGEKIDFFANVDFRGFKEIINTLWGIEIDVPKRLVDYKYPTEDWKYETVIFDKGKQTMNGDRALKYARSRHSTSDYDRSLRQQLVIQAIKNKVASTYLLTSPEKIGELYKVFDKNIFTNVGVNDAIQLILGIDVFNADFQFMSSNMNDSCYPGATNCKKWWIIYPASKEAFGGQAVSLFSDATPSTISTFKLSKKYSNVALNYPKVSTENYKIRIINATKYRGVAYKLYFPIKRYGFNLDYTDFARWAEKPLQTSKIYYHWIAKDSQTLKALQTFFKGEFKQVEKEQFPEIKKSNTSKKSQKTTQNTTKTDEKNIKQEAVIEIVIGNDYIADKSIFTF